MRIVADSSANLAAMEGANFVSVPMIVRLGEREYRDTSKLRVDIMLRDMRESREATSTACPGVGEWLDAFGGDEEIFALTLTSKLSGCYSAAHMAAAEYTDEHPESMDKFLLGGAVLAAAGMVYIMVKPYPMTYVDGALLVDPVKMRYDGLQDISALIMVMAAVYVDKKWIQYQPVEMKGPQIVIVIAGGAGLYWVITYLKAICIGAAGPEPGRVLYSFLSIFYIMVLVPFVLKMSASKEAGLQEVGAAE